MKPKNQTKKPTKNKHLPPPKKTKQKNPKPKPINQPKKKKPNQKLNQTTKAFLNHCVSSGKGEEDLSDRLHPFGGTECSLGRRKGCT